MTQTRFKIIVMIC